MSEGVLAASKGSNISLVELERELEGLLVEYESASQAWSKERDILTRARIGRRVEDPFAEIQRLQSSLITVRAKSLSDAAVHLRLLRAFLEDMDGQIVRFETLSGKHTRTMKHLLASALLAVEAAAGRETRRTQPVRQGRPPGARESARLG